MQSDPHDALVRLRVQDLRKAATRLQTQREGLVKRHEQATKEVETLSATVEKLAMAGELLRALMDKLVLDQVRAIESVVTEGLKTIFFDQTLDFIAEVGQSRGKIAIDLLIRRMNGDIEIIGPPLETMGGGVSSIASLTLRLLALMRLKKFPLLMLDETLSGVSADYVDPTGQFLSSLSETTGIPILLVTHNQSFLDHAKTAYQGHEDVYEAETSLGLRKLRGAK